MDLEIPIRHLLLNIVAHWSMMIVIITMTVTATTVTMTMMIKEFFRTICDIHLASWDDFIEVRTPNISHRYNYCIIDWLILILFLCFNNSISAFFRLFSHLSMIKFASYSSMTRKSYNYKEIKVWFPGEGKSYFFSCMFSLICCME